MTAGLHAQRILEAWELVNFNQFQTELDSALESCKTEKNSSALEAEERAVLETVSQHLSRMSHATDDLRPYRLEAGFTLLRHLKTRQVAQMAASCAV